LKAYEFFDKSPKFGKLVVIEGTERALADRALALAIDRLLDSSERDLNLDRFVASECGTFDGVAGALASLPFLGSRRVVVVRGAQDLRIDPRRALIAVAEHAPEGNVLVIEDLVSPASKRPEPLGKALGRAALRIDCSPGADARARFLRETLAELGATAAPAAIEMLIKADGDFAALRTDLEKLALGGTTIGLEDVLGEILVTEDVRAYQYASAAVAGRAADALALAHELFSSDPRGAAVPLLSALAMEYSLVWELARPGGTLPAKAKWRERELRAIARTIGERRARAGFERAVRGFEAVVTGRADDPRIIVESATAAGTAGQGQAGARREPQNR
jgi:DNA polymerase III delta subunit